MKSTLFILTLVSFFYTSPFVTAQTKIHEVNLSGNSYVTEQREGANITEKGLSNWTEESSLIICERRFRRKSSNPCQVQ